VFPETLIHANVAMGLGHVVSAGFCAQTADGWGCWDESISLNVASRDDDGTVLERFYK